MRKTISNLKVNISTTTKGLPFTVIEVIDDDYSSYGLAKRLEGPRRKDRARESCCSNIERCGGAIPAPALPVLNTTGIRKSRGITGPASQISPDYSRNLVKVEQLSDASKVLGVVKIKHNY